MKRALLLAVGLMMASTALAQKPPSVPDTGTRIQTAPSADAPLAKSMSDATRARVMLSRYATCIVQYRPAATIEYLAAYQYGSQADIIEKKLANNNCLSEGELKFNSEGLRGALYAALYLRDFSREAPVLQPQPIDFRADTDGDTSDNAKKYIVMRELGECLIRKEPAQARKLVLGPVGSDSESMAFKGLAPLLGECLPSNITTKIDKAGLIQIVAEVLYRLSVGGTNTSAAGAK
ncbi:hypothetical protein EUV02_05820 [Polymorphobacter arshaanensis]|uniref:Uncharacterized protein n=1 Tax=Glacieibacterium arshaanense TaxID=2511025 RepID=A0A4Y9ES84_9SPHN|nr:hypothetical protein [Polymorphobacter arshaanensis]TFU06497.1 hypothetical protein EUV02_05820 [Polymorphobacter arshaanensis]